MCSLSRALLVFFFLSAIALTVDAEERCPSGIRLNGECVGGGGLPEAPQREHFSLRPEALQQMLDKERAQAGEHLRLLQSLNGVAIGSQAAPAEIHVVDLPVTKACRAEMIGLIQGLKHDYVSRGAARLVVHEFKSAQEALAIRCASEQGRALRFLEVYLAEPPGTDRAVIAQRASIDAGAFSQCTAVAVPVTRPEEEASHLKGPAIESALFVDGIRMNACSPHEQIRALIEHELAMSLPERY